MAQRSPLSSVSNSNRTLSITHYLVCSTDADLSSPVRPQERPRKRPRLDDQENKPATFELLKEKSNAPNIERASYASLPQPLSHVTSSYQRLRSTRTSTRFSLPRPSSLPIIQCLVSSHTRDVFKIHAPPSADVMFDLPLACAFSHQSRRGKSSLLAVSTQLGLIDIIDTTKRADGDEESPRASMEASPDSGLFDVRWNAEDTRLAAASGDRSCTVFDVETRQPIAHLSGAHSTTVKQVQWNPANPNLLATASRDGNIFLWDLRENLSESAESTNALKPVGSILRGHRDETPNKRKKSIGSHGARSITSMIYGVQRDDTLYSSTSANGVIKLWDLRYTRFSHQCMETSPDSTMRDLSSVASPITPKRARGISSIVLDPTGSTIYALAADSRIHQYSALTLSPIVGQWNTPKPLSDPRLRVSSFYLRLAISPCGEWLASGSSGGPAFVWSLRDPTSRAVLLNPKSDGEVKETAAVDWASDGTLAICSDDCTVRIWRPDVAKARWCQEDPESSQWEWAAAQ